MHIDGHPCIPCPNIAFGFFENNKTTSFSQRAYICDVPQIYASTFLARRLQIRGTQKLAHAAALLL
jgi:hypothetical protein